MNKMVTEGLEQVVEELRRRGIAAGEREASARMAEAHEEAAGLCMAARAEAQRLVEQARQEAARQREQLDFELRQATEAGVVTFRRAVEAAVLVPAVSEAVDATLGDPAMLGELLVAAVAAFASSPGGDAALEVRLPATTSARLEAELLGRVTQVARGGVVLRLDCGVEGGFMLVAGRMQLDFRDAAFREVLLGFLTPRVRERVRRSGETS